MEAATPVILLVEDDKTFSLIIKDQVEKYVEGVKIIAVDNLGDAHKTFRESPVSLILLDLNLPDGYGPRSVAEIRSFVRHTPIVVITGMAPDITVEEALKLGANDVLQKTRLVDGTSLRDILAKHFPIKGAAT